MSNNRILRRIRTEFDYKSYLEVNVPVKYSGNGEIRVNCPSCFDEKYKCYVNDDKKYFNCFKCDFNSGNYDVFDFVGLVEGITRPAAMLKLTREFTDTAKSWEEIIADSAPIDVQEDEVSTASPIKVLDSLPEPAVLLTDKKDPDQARFWEYLLSRGMTETEITAIKAYCIPVERCYIFDANKKLRGNVGNRVLFPIYGGDNKLVGWQARAIDATMPKYLNAPDSEASRTFWPYVPPRGSQCVLVEGILDALAVKRGRLNAYATLGKSLSYDQIDLLVKWGITTVVLFWDKKDAKKETLKAIEILKVYFEKVYVPDLSKWPDADSGDTLSWEDGPERLRTLLLDNLIDVNSLEFATWQL